MRLRVARKVLGGGRGARYRTVTLLRAWRRELRSRGDRRVRLPPAEGS